MILLCQFVLPCLVQSNLKKVFNSKFRNLNNLDLRLVSRVIMNMSYVVLVDVDVDDVDDVAGAGAVPAADFDFNLGC